MIGHEFIKHGFSKVTEDFKRKAKKLGQETIRDLEQVCFKQDHDYLFVVVRDNFAEVDIIIFISHVAYRLFNSITNLVKNFESIRKT